MIRFLQYNPYSPKFDQRCTRTVNVLFSGPDPARGMEGLHGRPPSAFS